MVVKLLLGIVLLQGFLINARADEDVTGRHLPKWELGLAFLNFYLPDFPGAKEARYRFWPLPYFIYRGKIFRADREGGARMQLIGLKKFEFDVSLRASFPTDSEDNKARQGMVDLDWMGEFGPRIKYEIARTPIVKLGFELPVRYVFSIDKNLQNMGSRGFTVSPELNFQHRALFNAKGFFSASLVGTWATEELMDYFYEVRPQDVLPNRSEYNADGGFLSFSTRLSYRHPIFSGDYIAFIGISQHYYAGAENRGSPLLEDIETQSYFLGLAWNLYCSEDKAEN